MISCIEGRLVSVANGRAHVRCGPLTYELHVPAADEQHLAARLDDDVAFHTLHYLEGQGQGASFVPRLIGFVRDEDRAFFELFTTVKGMGSRKALRALALPFPTVAEAIAAKDLDVLKSLPEVGKRTAETIVAELHGKVDRFVELKPTGVEAGGPPADPAAAARATLVHDTVTVLTQLGEPPLPARQLVERALEADPGIDDAEALLSAAYRLKELG
jgi:Holliday junction DNA helicase RuvA